ncbi:MAG: hypothetical protein PVSMB7_20680 [Chloroflexota bacterium]
MRTFAAFIVALGILVLGIAGIHAVYSAISGDGGSNAGRVAGVAVRATTTAIATTPAATPVPEAATPRALTFLAHPRTATKHVAPSSGSHHAEPQHLVPTPSFIIVSGGPPVPRSPAMGTGGAGSPLQFGYKVAPQYAQPALAISLERYWLFPPEARPGRRVTLWYVISNRTGRTVRLILGASIKSSRVPSWMVGSIADRWNEVVATVPPGTTTHMRVFMVPRQIQPGWYDVAWGLRSAVTHIRVALGAKTVALRIPA